MKTALTCAREHPSLAETMSMKSVYSLLPAIAGLALVAAGCSGCNAAREPVKDDGEAAERTEIDALPVEIATVTRGPIESTISASANIEAERSVQVTARSDGMAERLFVEEGDRVKSGDLLVRLDDSAKRNQVVQISNDLENARRDLDREQRLFQQQLSSEQAYSAAKHRVEQLEHQLEDARLQLSYSEIRAPIGGTITQRLVSVGDRVTPGRVVFEIVDFDSLVARIYVPEKDLSRLEKGLSARVTAQAVEGKVYGGRLDRIAPIVEKQTGTVKATIAIGWQPGLLPGMYVDVELVTDTHQSAILVPKRAISYDGEQAFVYKVDDQLRVARVSIDPVLENQAFVEPERDAIAPGDRVVVAGQAALKDGARVRDVNDAVADAGVDYEPPTGAEPTQ